MELEKAAGKKETGSKNGFIEVKNVKYNEKVVKTKLYIKFILNLCIFIYIRNTPIKIIGK